MKRIISIIFAFLFVANIAAQSSKGGIYIKESMTNTPLKESNYWTTCPSNPQFRDLYLQVGTKYKINVTSTKGRILPEDCTFSSSDNSVVKMGYEFSRVADPKHNSADWGYKEGELITERYPDYAVAKKVSDKPVIVTVKHGDAECSIRIFVYSDKATLKQDGNNCWRVLPEIPVSRGTRCYVTVNKRMRGMEINQSPKWSLTFNNGRYCLTQDVVSPGVTYELYYKLGDNLLKKTVTKTDPVKASDLKPGDFVVYNASKKRYEAIDGGLRGSNSNVGADASSFKNQVIGIVATVYDDGPEFASGLKGIYTSDGKVHHALVMDLRDGDRKWEYSSDNDPMSIVDNSFLKDRIGYKLTQEFLPYNERRGASHRIKPIYWIVTCNSTRPLQPGTTGWYLPSVYEMEHAAIREVNTSIGLLIKAGRTDVSRVLVGSDYWTSQYGTQNDKAMAWNYDDQPYVQKVFITTRKKQAELFIRAVFSL